MNSTNSSSWQVWIAAIALMIIVPATVQLGFVAFLPKYDWKTYWQEYSHFFQDLKKTNEQEFHEQESKWHQTDIYRQYQQSVGLLKIIKLMICAVLAITFFVASSFMPSHVLAAAVLNAGLIIYVLRGVTMSSRIGAWHTINFNLLEFLIALFGLIVVLSAAYRDSQED